VLSERLEVRLPPETMQVLRREAAERGTTVADVVRTAIDSLLYEDRPARLRAAETLFGVGASVADWATMKGQIEEAHTTG
jgi:hypothetical protein